MSSIRRQSILSSVVIYIGFAIGLVNIFFFVRYFTPAQYGLTGVFVAIATMMMAFANLAMPSYILKFYHYYNDHLSVRKNDMITWALVISTFGFALVLIAGWVFKHLVIRKFGENSPELLQYYYWIFPMGFGLTVFTVLEAYTWNVGKPILTNFLKEVQWRLITTVLIVFFVLKLIPDFDIFIKLYAFTYPAIGLTLFIYLLVKKKIHFTFSISKVSRRFFRKMATLCLFVYSGTVIFTLSQVFDTLVLASVSGLDKAGIFTLATLMTSIIGAPQRAVIAAAIPHLARAWKDKNHALLQKIYQRSSINMLIFASGIFCLIALNYREAIITFQLQPAYLLGFSAFVLLGITRIIDLGTGVNNEIIATSNYWRFQLLSGIVLLVLMLPLTYFLARKYDVLGPAIANFISITIYNIIRIIFLWKKFRLFPFTKKSLYAVLLAGICFTVTYVLFHSVHGFAGLVVRTVVFMILFGTGVWYFAFSPDVNPVVSTILHRLRIRRKTV